MLSDKTLLIGTREEKVIQCLKKAGWYSGRKSDITDVESYYGGKGITLTEPQKAIFPVPILNFILCPEMLSSCFILMIGYYNYDLDLIRDMQELEQAAGEIPVFIGRIGYYYPSFIYAVRNGRLWVITEGRLIEAFDNMTDLVTYHFSNPKIWSSVRMKQRIITKKR